MGGTVKRGDGRYVYVSGPISLGELTENIAKAVDAADELFRAGLHPYIPHVGFLWQYRHQHGYEEWMALDLAWLANCDAVVRIPGESKGADREVARAQELGIPVYFSVQALLDSPLGVADEASEPETA